MKVAVCLYGYPVNPEIGRNSLKYFLQDIDHDFFIHSWNGIDNLSQSNFDITREKIIKLFNPKEFLLENQLLFKNTFEFPHDLSCLKPDLVNAGIGVSTFLSTLYSIKQSANLLKNSINTYDIVILTRMDIFSKNALNKYQFLSYDEIYSSFCNGKIWDLNNNGDSIDLKMIASDKKNMDFIMNVYDYVESYIKDEGIKVCHHRIMAHHAKKLNKKFNMMFSEPANWFIIRDGGILKGELYDSHITNYKNIL